MIGPDEREGFRRLESLFMEAVELDPASREEYVRAVEISDPPTAVQLRELIARHEDSRSSVDAAAVPPLVQRQPSTPLEGATIGDWKVVRLIARGGWADVYEAVQTNPPRACAIKILRGPWVAATRTARRFREEASLLGRMHHAGIAHVYGAGVHATPAGEIAYLAMELIEGAIPVTEFARTRNLSRRERLELFLAITDAVHSAHQRGVLHRDLKPSNILVGADRMPRVIDFGVARSIDGAGTITLQGEIVGTLAYISPEQLFDPIGGADVRSDVYSLGVILYELILGRLPISLPPGIAGAARTLRETDPAHPTSVDPSVARDLAVVLLTALEKDPDRRYQSAAELGADVRAVLDSRPIAARPTPLARRALLAARRRPTLALATAFALLAATIAMITATRGWRAQARERRVSESVLSVLDEAMTSARSHRRGDEVLVSDLAAAAEARLDSGELSPSAAAKVHEILGRTYENLGRYSEALSHYQRGLALARELWDNDDPLLIQLEIELAGSLYDSGDPLASAAALEELLVRHRTLEPLELAKINNDLSISYLKGGDPVRALAPGKISLDLRVRETGPRSALSLQTRTNLGALYMRAGEFSTARDELGEAVAGAAGLGPGGLSLLAHARTYLGFTLAQLGEFEDSARQSALAQSDATISIGPKHPTYANLMGTWAEAALVRGQRDEATALAREAADLTRELLGDSHPDAIRAAERVEAFMHGALPTQPR